ncbi:N-(5'-phosphoribosyl)anthranilate isomerase (plasmid) [Acaryochloris marina MBIC10699]|nr:N-(5'-phosphoribosyl)anthranilate isomerase [Acaryochloris marina MBIC10699]
MLAIDCGASALGLVSAMPSGPGIIDESLVAEIAAAVPPGIATFLLTSEQDPDIIIQQQHRCRTNTVQLCDRIETVAYPILRQALPGIKLVQVIHVQDKDAINEARLISQHVDAILLDSGNQNLEVKELGGTGRVHDWQISRQIREEIDVPLFLAGGLKPDNVRVAIEQVEPFGLDLCSGVRTDDRLDENKLRSFFKAVRETTEQR